jgi:hypothetical protein
MRPKIDPSADRGDFSGEIPPGPVFRLVSVFHPKQRKNPHTGRPECPDPDRETAPAWACRHTLSKLRIIPGKNKEAGSKFFPPKSKVYLTLMLAQQAIRQGFAVGIGKLFGFSNIDLKIVSPSSARAVFRPTMQTTLISQIPVCFIAVVSSHGRKKLTTYFFTGVKLPFSCDQLI